YSARSGRLGGLRSIWGLLGRRWIDARARPLDPTGGGATPVLRAIGERRRVGALAPKGQATRGELVHVAAAIRIGELARQRLAHGCRRCGSSVRRSREETAVRRRARSAYHPPSRRRRGLVLSRSRYERIRRQEGDARVFICFAREWEVHTVQQE